MDKMDKLLHELPSHEPSMKLASQIHQMVHRRHRRRQMARRTTALACAISGLWLIAPVFSVLSLNEFYSSGAPWLLNGLDAFSLETYQIVEGLWNGMFSLQNAIGSSLFAPVWLGILLLCFGMFFTVDMQVFQMPFQSYGKG